MYHHKVIVFLPDNVIPLKLTVLLCPSVSFNIYLQFCLSAQYETKACALKSLITLYLGSFGMDHVIIGVAPIAQLCRPKYNVAIRQDLKP